MHDLYLAGADLGNFALGYNNNFAWGDFTLGSGVSAKFWDGNAEPGAALYAGLFEMADGAGQLSYIYSDFNIYYDPRLAGNAYLENMSYALNGLGFLMPSAVPIPPAVWLFSSGLLGLVGVARRRAPRSKHRGAALTMESDTTANTSLNLTRHVGASRLVACRLALR
jgi:hypothetical protein